MVDPNKHGVYNMKTISGTHKRWWKASKTLIRGIVLLMVFALSSYGMYEGGEFSDIAFCIWCLTLVQLTEI